MLPEPETAVHSLLFRVAADIEVSVAFQKSYHSPWGSFCDWVSETSNAMPGRVDGLGGVPARFPRRTGVHFLGSDGHTCCRAIHGEPLVYHDRFSCPSLFGTCHAVAFICAFWVHHVVTERFRPRCFCCGTVIVILTLLWLLLLMTMAVSMIMVFHY